ncbi:response regulator transcription factor [uncultured Rhodoferax sp.]|uniref:response regulator n=1 Tax=uncultured Rhodoferax sp. TaxID=223188 RepID=UPI0025ED19DF|nr:response regulator transcription factor [uncultured Rhodoferax sp.]
MIQITLCDDHAMIRRGIKDTLSEHVDMKVVAEAGNYAELKEALRNAPCDVLILDLNLPGRGGLEILGAIQESHPHIKVLVVSMFSEDQYALRSLKAGANGYLNKAGDPSELVEAVRVVAKGRRYVTATVSEMLVDQLSNPGTESLHSRLSERELQTLLKIASGKRLTDIAEELMLSPKTVSVYRARLLEKLGLSNNAELAVYAIRNGLV